jgi:hypothetical protein
MILVLSCFDLAVVSITHPFLIVCTIYFFICEETDEVREARRVSIFFLLYFSSMFALFTLNVERFLALTCPFFHQTSVTKTRIVCFQAFVTIILAGLSPFLYFIPRTFGNILAVVIVLSLLLLFIYSNYKIFVIAKSKREDERLALTRGTAMDESRKKQTLNLKTVSTCSLAVGCFFLWSCPQIIASVLRLASETPFFDRQVLFFNLWSNTFLSINSTFNCLIFFWRNTILRREGMKIVDAFRIRITK